MSRRPKNNHYHYAEKFEDRRRMRVSDVLKAPRKAFTLAFLALLAFGLISTTFAAYISSEDFTENNNGSIIINTRNTIAEREGISAQKDDSDLAGTGADVDINTTGAQTYYYKGEGNGTNWAKTAMTVSNDGFYEYYYVSTNTTHQFLIGTASNENAYNYTYVTAGFNGTNVSEIGDYSKNNCYCWKGSAHYIIVYYPNTVINTTSNPIICASTTKPDNAPRVTFGTKYNNSDTFYSMTDSSGTWSGSASLTGGRDYEFWFMVKYGTGTNDPIKYYKDQNAATMTYNNCTNWQFEENNNGNPKLTTVITGSYTFSFVLSTKKVSVTYPKYSVSASRNITAAANAPTVGTSSVSIGSSSTVTAAAANTGYEFVRWDVTGGKVKTGSYSGTAITTSTSNPLTIYPYDSTANISLQAVYKVKEYTITYSKGSTSGISGTVAAGTKQYGVAYPISSSTFTRSGYTQVGWSTTENATSIGYSFGYTYTANANLTLYPVWSINAPTVSITGTTHTAGGSASTLTSSATHASGLSVTKTYTITAGPSGSILPGTQGQTANCGITSGGAFTAEIPGTYTVSLTGTVSNSSTTNGSASATTTCTVTVVPAKPSLTLTLNGYSGEGTGTQASPFKIILGETYHFSAAVDDPKAGYTYSWSKTGEDGTWNNFSGESNPYQSPTYSSTTTPTTVNGNDTISFQSVTPTEPCDAVSFTLYLKTEMNGQSASADPVTVYYFVEPLIKTFDFLPVQKIYNERFDNSRINVEYNLSNATGYTTTMYFSSDNSSYYPIQRKSNEFITSFENTLKNYFYPRGVKYFKMSITKGNLQSSQMLHTTVGTDDKDAVRPFYFINGVSGLDLSNYRVVAYWADPDSPSGYSYQTAQDIYKGVTGKTEGVRYRINLPPDATDVVFAVANKDYYGTPTYDEGVYTFMNPDAQTTFFYYYTENVILGDENCYTVNSSDGASLPMLSGSLGYFNAE